MLFPAKEMIRKRKSVRSFDGAPLRAEDRAALEAFTQTLENVHYIISFEKTK